MTQPHDQLPAADTVAAIQDLAGVLALLAQEYPTEGATVSVQLAVPGPEINRRTVGVQREHVDQLTRLVKGELTSARNAHRDGDGTCGFCRGTGSARDRLGTMPGEADDLEACTEAVCSWLAHDDLGRAPGEGASEAECVAWHQDLHSMHRVFRGRLMALGADKAEATRRYLAAWGYDDADSMGGTAGAAERAELAGTVEFRTTPYAVALLEKD